MDKVENDKGEMVYPCELSFHEAKRRVIFNIKQPKKNRENAGFNHSKYADLHEVFDSLRFEQYRYGLRQTQLIVGNKLVTEIANEAGVQERSEHPLLELGATIKQWVKEKVSQKGELLQKAEMVEVTVTPQMFKGSITYAKRTATESHWMIAADDDDGNTASGVQAGTRFVRPGVKPGPAVVTAKTTNQFQKPNQ